MSVVSPTGVGLQWPLPPQNERWSGSTCGHLTCPPAEEEHTGDGLGKVCLIVFLCNCTFHMQLILGAVCRWSDADVARIIASLDHVYAMDPC